MLAVHKAFETMTAADVMSRDVLVIPEHMDLPTAAHLLTQTHRSGAPVIDADGVCIGVLSTTDFVRWAEHRAGGASEADPLTADVCSDWQVVEPRRWPDNAAASYMTPDPVTAGLHARLPALAGKMIEAHIHRVIIVDEENHPIGIVTSTDILAALARGAED